jgi:hypothetical protein
VYYANLRNRAAAASTQMNANKRANRSKRPSAAVGPLPVKFVNQNAVPSMFAKMPAESIGMARSFHCALRRIAPHMKSGANPVPMPAARDERPCNPTRPTRKVILVRTPNKDTSSAKQEDLDFWVDDEAKTLAFLDNKPLTVTRFERSWISANRDGIFYELNRGNSTISYASSTIKDGVSTTIVGSGRCEVEPDRRSAR